jgi:hypothetical protein
MKIPVIKKLVESFTVEELSQAEKDIVEGIPVSKEVEGEDEGEQLTHVIAASLILQDMKNRKVDFKEALRDYTRKVRESIN